ncbi:hypothetical protein [Ethanoligenens sp.]|uniref:hypothetical protein n=1 Tax=Ethanoligenens sp. TaxID=2099655 RepID=UPI0039EABE0E
MRYNGKGKRAYYGTKRKETRRAAAKAALFWYIEAFYNSVRPHSALGWVAPKTFEKDWRLTAAASAMKAVAIR